MLGSVLFILCLFSRFGQAVVCSGGRHSSWPCPQGVGVGVGGVWVGRGHCSRCFLSVGGGGGGHRECLMTGTSGSVTSPPLFLTPPFPDMCQSVPGQYGDPARLPIRHVLPRQGLAALHSTVHQRESFSPPPPAKCVGRERE